ncbi:3-deoxy-7-phosphoheptulonate synthase [Streptococcus sp. H31]|uniref:3-deoxy-7-phosphoheptulonate synthase n=1 Tax=Streptococcus huangxiaojuni TaxID=3237239 RepID=UPI0034A44FB4
MGIHQKSAALDIAQIKALSKLEGRFLDRKLARDQELAAIIRGEDERLLLVIGPCSSDDERAVLDYARRLAELQEAVKDKIFMVMRVYTSKPRTNGDGYKGMIHQPDTKSAPSLIDGIAAVRRLHSRIITETGLTTADEMLYPSNLSFLDDLVSYHAIGARSVEDQEHRFVASGLDVPTGMKNPTSGNLTVMFNAIYAAQNRQTFIFHDAEVETDGNPLAHAILRGGAASSGENQPNYAYEDLLKAISQYEKMGLKNPFLLIDANHDNSGKNYLEQIRIVRQTLINRDWNEKIKRCVRGFMIESYLEDGRQDKPEIYGKSITDPCLGWEKTEKLVREIYTFLGIGSYEELIFKS